MSEAAATPWVMQASLLDNSIAALPAASGARGAGGVAASGTSLSRGRATVVADASPSSWGAPAHRPRSRTPQDGARGAGGAAASSLPSPAFSTASGFSASRPPIAPGRGGASSAALPPRASASGRPPASEATAGGRAALSRASSAAALVPAAAGQAATAWPAAAAAAPTSGPVFSRVKVAVRCRPPFPEEGPVSAVKIGPSVNDPEAPPEGEADVLRPRTLQLEVSPGKLREFTYDVVFGPECDNNDVYNGIAGPVVEGVLNGVNGTVLAYGQTGSGKTHSLGILARITGESGIIPRSLSHIFGAIQLEQAAAAAGAGSSSGSTPGTRSYTVTLSFCQLYLDSVHDLLASSASLDGSAPPTSGSVDASFASAGSGVGNRVRTASTASATGGGGSNSGASSSSAAPTPPINAFNLPIREDPARGFYVEGLTEYSVSCFEEAVALLNWGLGNRILGATRMNATSSRSHTILTVKVESREAVALPQAPAAAEAAAAGVQAFVTRRAQLMLCDLAGSERVRRTSSKGARLEEARAINGSLHTLGQVIAALSVASSAAGAGQGAAAARVHVPWRDSKLTRLLYGNLGGSSNTYLLGTVGPDPQNVSETLSTLLFASRCMRVSASPVVAASALAAAGDYADLCSKLQARLSGIEATHAREMNELQRRYEATLVDLQGQLTNAQSRSSLLEQGALSAAAAAAAGSSAAFAPASSSLDGAEGATPSEATYRVACQMFDAGAAPLLLNAYRSRRAGAAWLDWIARTQALEAGAGSSGSSEGGGSSAARARAGSVPGADALAAASDEEDDEAAGAEGGAAGTATPAPPTRSAARALALVHAQHRDASLLLPPGASNGGVEPPEDPVTAALGDALLAGVSGRTAAAPAAPADMSALLRTPATPPGCALAPAALALLAADPRTSASTAAEPGVEDLLRAGLRAVAAALGTTAAAAGGAAAAPVDAVWGSAEVAAPPPLFSHPPYASLASTGGVAAYLAALGAAHAENARRVNALLQVKDVRFNDTKRHLLQVELALRERDSDAVMHRQMLRLLLRERDDGAGTGSSSLDGSFGPGGVSLSGVSAGLGRATPGLGRLTPLLTPSSAGVGGGAGLPTPLSGGMSPHWLVHEPQRGGSVIGGAEAGLGSKVGRGIAADVEEEEEEDGRGRSGAGARVHAGPPSGGGLLPLGSPIQSAASSVASSPVKGSAVATPVAIGGAAAAAATVGTNLASLPPPPPPPPSQPPRSTSRSRTRAAPAAPLTATGPLPSPITLASPVSAPAASGSSAFHPGGAASTPAQPPLLPALPSVSALLGAGGGTPVSARPPATPAAAGVDDSSDEEDDDNDYGSQLDASEVQGSPSSVGPLPAARLGGLTTMPQTPGKEAAGGELGIAQRRGSGSGLQVNAVPSVINKLTALEPAPAGGAHLPPRPSAPAPAPAPVIVSVPLHALNTSGISVAEAEGGEGGLDTLSVSLLGESEPPRVAAEPAPLLVLPGAEEEEQASSATPADVDASRDSSYAGQFGEADNSFMGGSLGGSGVIGPVDVSANASFESDGGGGGDVIERIVGHQLVVPQQLGLSGSPGSDSSYRLLYKVHWKGSDSSEDEWFDRASILLDFPRVVAAYESSKARLRADPSLAHALYMLGALPGHVYAQYVPRGGAGGGGGSGSGAWALLSPVPESPRSPRWRSDEEEE